MLGWRLGTPTADDIILYSDLVMANAGGQYVAFDFLNGTPSDYLFTQWSKTYADQTLAANASTDLTYGNQLVQTSMSATDYATMFGSADGLFGLSWLPWNPYGLIGPGGTGAYYLKQYANTSPTVITSYVTCNPLRREVLEIKMITLLKNFGIGIGAYLLIKLFIKYADK